MSVCTIGAANVDLVARVPVAPAPGATVMATGFARHPGGKGANQAVAASRAGAITRLVAQIGRDGDGAWLAEFLADERLELADLQRSPDRPTGQAFITVADDGENMIVVVAGANATLMPPHWVATPPRDVRVLLAQLETAIAPVAELFRAPWMDCVKILNAAPAVAEGAALFGSADVLILNETELASYAPRFSPGDGTDAAIVAARGLLVDDRQQIIITLGAQGALLVRARDDILIPPHPAVAIDTVGAGDCFCGVLAAGLDAGLGMQAAIERANAAAAIVVGRPGAAAAMPTRSEIDAAFQ